MVFCMEEFYVNCSKHKLAQRNGELVRNLIARHREVLVDVRKRLKRIGRMGKCPDGRDVGVNLLKAAVLPIKDRVHGKMMRERTHEKEIDLGTAIRMLQESETELEVPDFRFTAAATKGTEGKQTRRYDEPGGGNGRGDKGGNDVANEEKAKAVYARRHGMDKNQVTLDRVSEEGWGSDKVGSSVGSEGGSKCWKAKSRSHTAGRSHFN